ncbi:unknown [Candidatus Colimorpha enterica]|uniref:Uncharacterized protein n=1 Tax=Candidatus Colimorpha enterica TaxID=3083063 RepID=R6UHX6_9BACT|nr:unknown [Candidatus Colimorpha enterica]
MDYPCPSRIRNLGLHVVVDLEGKVGVVLHVVVHALENVVAGGTQRDKHAVLLLSRHDRADGGELCRYLVLCGGICTAAALPFRQLVQCDPESLRRKPCIYVKLLRLCLQRTSGIITVFHLEISFRKNVHSGVAASTCGAPVWIRMSDHLFGMENLVEFFFGQESELYARLPE